ncbi:hypothetical protein RugamoR64_50940 [Duganella rhizosphaerae]|uniref:hypothetical protein n=1 Tax=Duganella rhizosphaerae TaxID=2885763 RepID=UPI0030E9881B
MRKLLMLALLGGLAQLAGCYTVNQAGLGNFVTQTIQPGMPLDQALVRMRAEGFNCNTSTAGTVTICTRDQPRLLRGSCLERVDLMRSATSTQTLGTIDVMEIRCTKF